VRNPETIVIGDLKGKVYFGKLNGDERVIWVWTID
jgi:hypothetical protein